MTSKPARSAGRNRRRRSRRGTVVGGSVAAAAVVGGILIALPTSASAASLAAVYTQTSTWDTGYSGQYLVSNPDSKPIDDWTLSFDLPAGARISSLWNAVFTASGQHITVRPQSWSQHIDPGRTVDVGFVVQAGGAAAQAEPANCTINGASCKGGSSPAPTPSGRPTATPTPTPTPTRTTASPTPTPKPTATTAPPTTAPPASGGSAAGFSPYVDTSLYPPFDLVSTAKATGVKHFNLAFLVSGGGCTPKWGGVTDLTADAVAGQIGALRGQGGDVRVSFGGASGSELALACGSADQLAAAYGKAVDAFGLDEVDFDVEGAAIGNTAANTRRDQAIAQLQKAARAKGKQLDVSFTLPALPSGLTQEGVSLIADAKQQGVDMGAVNIMAMDYGDGAAPNPSGRMGTFAIDAATATQAQVKSVLGLSDSAAWSKVAITPMIGVNDVSTEVFTVADAKQVADFAAGKHLAWLSMWSAARDKACPGGAKASADATCSSIAQQPSDFARAFNTFTG
ncbi:cellulose binding domain-containing protein [Peterkaempfera sp. SMS 1(5)a]|uniref:cellulose binding domain-containing protein n=1 Tax=Peterkaempfera podocarpi TaxID=3232308 RepID=UPI00366F5B80